MLFVCMGMEAGERKKGEKTMTFRSKLFLLLSGNGEGGEELREKKRKKKKWPYLPFWKGQKKSKKKCLDKRPRDTHTQKKKKFLRQKLLQTFLLPSLPIHLST